MPLGLVPSDTTGVMTAPCPVTTARLWSPRHALSPQSVPGLILGPRPGRAHFLRCPGGTTDSCEPRSRSVRGLRRTQCREDGSPPLRGVRGFPPAAPDSFRVGHLKHLQPGRHVPRAGGQGVQPHPQAHLGVSTPALAAGRTVLVSEASEGLVGLPRGLAAAGRTAPRFWGVGPHARGPDGPPPTPGRT